MNPDRLLSVCVHSAQELSSQRSSQQKGNKMQKFALLFVTILFLSVGQVNAQSTPDSELIKQAALDYIEGWYEGNAERMERALHPELAKRIVNTEHGERAHRCLDLGGLPARRQVERPLGDRECRVGAAAAIGPAGHSFEHARRTT